MKRFKNYYLSEAYTVIPKSEGEIDILKIAMDKEKLKDLFKYIVAKTNMPDPIAIPVSYTHLTLPTNREV